MTADRTIQINEYGLVTTHNPDGTHKSGAFRTGARVRKKLSENAGEWQGYIVGAYLTNNGVGYAVRSEREKKSVQIYPEAALELVP